MICVCEGLLSEIVKTAVPASSLTATSPTLSTAASLSTIVPVASLRATATAPLGLVRSTANCSVGSWTVSPMTGTVIVVVVCPAGMVAVAVVAL